MTAFLSVPLLLAAIRIATPLYIGALGGIFSERSGVVNVGLEGMMLIGAFAAAIVSYFSGSPWLGVAGAAAAGALFGALHAVVCLHFRADHVISGVAINILSSSLTIFLLQLLFKNKGQSPTAPSLPTITIPVLNKVPFIGALLFNNAQPLVLMGLLLVLATHILLYRTKWGLRMRSIGEHPQAAAAAGVSVMAMKYVGVIISGALAGLAGSFLSIGILNVFTKNMTAGRGFMSLAAMIFGRWTPLGSLLASLFFGYALALQISLQNLQIPAQFVEIIPYFSTLLVLTFVSKKVKPPASVGKHYEP